MNVLVKLINYVDEKDRLRVCISNFDQAAKATSGVRSTPKGNDITLEFCGDADAMISTLSEKFKENIVITDKGIVEGDPLHEANRVIEIQCEKLIREMA